MTKKISKRHQVLIAANNLVLDKGASHLTLEAVASLAGVSKGGLLYHFPSKDALIAGMINQTIEDFDNRLESIYNTLPAGKGRWLQAFVEASFKDDISPQIFVAIAGAITDQPELLEPLQKQSDSWIEYATRDGFSTEVAQIVIAATSGIWLERIFWNNPSQDQLKTSLLKLIDNEVKQ